MTESGPQQSEPSSELREGVQVVSEGKKRGKYLPRELRTRAYDRAVALRQQGLSYSKIIDVIEQEYRIRLSYSHISYWTRGLHSPYNEIATISIEQLEPSEEVAYIIGVVLGDGSVYITFKIRRTTRVVSYRIALEAKDKEFVEKFARYLCILLGRKRIKVRYERSKGTYHVDVGSKALYELLKEPDLERLRKYIEHCDKCVAAFLRGFVDSEASVKKDGYILISNTNYELITYIQKLLKRFGIETTGPRPIMHYDPKTGRQYKTEYVIYIRTKSYENFYRYIGFTIRRKQERLEGYLRRTGKI